MVKRSLTVQKQAFWGGVIEEHANSGLSVQRFCQQKQLAESTFYAWRKRMTLLNNESSEASSVSALSLTLPSPDKMALPASSPSPAKVASSSLSPPATPSRSSFISLPKLSPLSPSAQFMPITVNDTDEVLSQHHDEEVLSQHHEELDALSKPKEANPSQDMSHCPIEVVLSGGRTIRLRGRFDRQVFLEAVQVLESLSC